MRVKTVDSRTKRGRLLVPENHKLLRPKLKLSKLLAYAMDALKEVEQDKNFQVEMEGVYGMLVSKDKPYVVSLSGALMAKCLPIRSKGPTYPNTYHNQRLAYRLTALEYIQAHYYEQVDSVWHYDREPTEKGQICWQRVLARLKLAETDPTNPLPAQREYTESKDNWWSWMVMLLHFLRLEGL